MVKDFLKTLTPEQKKALADQLNKEAREERSTQRAAYEGVRDEFMETLFARLAEVVTMVENFHDFVTSESAAFRDIMRDYGQLRREEQNGFTLTTDQYKLEVRSNKVKRFDERADLAAERLMDYLASYIKARQDGADDPLYQLCMSLLERNRQGDLDYKSISKLYDLEDKFDEEYKAIMDLFRESNIVQGTAINYYFWKRNPETLAFQRIEPSFCRI